MSEFEEKLFKKNKVYAGKVIDLYCDEVVLKNGKHATREYLKQSGASAVLPFLDKEKIVLVRQFRYPVGQETFELPAGKMDAGETPLQCALRELQEETGYTTQKAEKMLAFHPTTAFSTELLHIFVAHDLKAGATNPDEDEFVANEIVDFKVALEWVKQGKIVDAKTIIALLYFKNNI